MALKKSEKRLLVILGIAIVIFIFDKFILGGKEEPPPPPKKAAGSKKGSSVPVNVAARRQAKVNGKAVQFDDWGRDPFNKVVSQSVRQTSVQRNLERNHKLKGILWNEGKVFALIDDLVLCEGETKEGISLKRIRGNAATCSKGGRTFTLRMEEK